MFKVTCRKCLAVLRLSDERLGETVKCPACGQAIRVIAAPKAATVKLVPRAATIRHACVRCGTVLETMAENVGQMEECPKCGTRLMVPAAPPRQADPRVLLQTIEQREKVRRQALDRERAKLRQLVARDCGQLAIVDATPFTDPEMIRLCRQGRDLIRSIQQCNKRARKLRETLAATDPKTEHAKFLEVREHLAVLERKIPKIQRALNSMATTLGQMIIDQAPAMPQFQQILLRLNEPVLLDEQDQAVAPHAGEADMGVVGTLWYCRVNGQAFGPTNVAGLVTWLQQGHLKLDDSVRSEEMPEWFVLKEVRDLPPLDDRRQDWPGEFMQALAAVGNPAGGAAPDEASFWRHGAAALRKAATRVGLLRKELGVPAHHGDSPAA